MSLPLPFSAASVPHACFHLFFCQNCPPHSPLPLPHSSFTFSSSLLAFSFLLSFSLFHSVLPSFLSLHCLSPSLSIPFPAILPSSLSGAQGRTDLCWFTDAIVPLEVCSLSQQIKTVTAMQLPDAGHSPGLGILHAPWGACV